MDILATAASVSRAVSKLTKPQKLAALSGAQQILGGNADPVAVAASTVARSLGKLSADDQKGVIDFATSCVNREEEAPVGSAAASAAANS